MSTDEEGRYLVTGYVPKLALSVVALTCFLVLAIIFWFRFWRSGKKWMLCLCIGTTTMAAGFGIRIPSTNDPYSISIYIPQTLFILLSPCAFLAQNYILLPRLATWLDSEECLFMKSRIIVRTFVWADVITFLLQASGSGLTAMDNPSLQDVGHWIAVVGLIIQLLFFATFSILLLIFGYRVRKSTPWKWSNTITTKAPGSDMTMTTRLGWLEDWRTLYWALVWTIIGFLVRSIFRIIEYAQGYDGELRTTEVYFYVLDSLPIFLALAVWTVVWPPLILTEHSKPFQDAHFQGSSNGYPLLAPNGGRLSDRHLSGNSAYGKV